MTQSRLESLTIQHIAPDVAPQIPFLLSDANGLLEQRQLPSLSPACDQLVVATTSWGDVVGVAQASYGSEGVWLSRIATARHYERRGLGAALLGSICLEAAEDNSRGLLLLTPSAEAIGFYERLGFRRSEEWSEEDEREVWFSPIGALVKTIAQRTA